MRNGARRGMLVSTFLEPWWVRRESVPLGRQTTLGLAGWLVLVFATGCGHLVGGAIHDDSRAIGLRYYLPRSQFAVDHESSPEGPVARVSVLRVPDFRYPHQIYLQQGLFSADIFDVQVDPTGLLVGVSSDASDKSIESAKALGSLALSVASTIGGLPLPAKAGTDLPPERSAAAQPVTPASNPSCPPAAANLRALTATLDAFASEGGAAVRAVKAATAATEVDVQVEARTTLKKLVTCLKDIDGGSAAMRASIEAVVNGDDPQHAYDMTGHHLHMELARRLAAAEARDLEIVLLDGYLGMSPVRVREMLKKLGVEEKQIGAFCASTKPALLNEGLPGTSAEAVRTALAACGRTPREMGQGTLYRVREAATVCMPVSGPRGAEEAGLTRQDVASVSLLLSYVTAVMDCLIREQESRRDRMSDERFHGYLAALPALHRIATRVLFPTDEARQEPTEWPVSPKYWDPSFREENLLQRSLWIRDHLSDGSWRAKQLASEARRFRVEADAIRETLGRAPDVGHLLRQRAALRRFLAGAVTPDTVRARARAQHELGTVEQKLHAARTFKSHVAGGPTRRVTPMVLWIARDARLPEEGSRAFGIPGDVVILVRSAVETVGGGKPR